MTPLHVAPSAWLLAPYVLASLSWPGVADPNLEGAPLPAAGTFDAAGAASADVERSVLPNGIVVLSRQRLGADVVALQLLVGSGARDETDDQAGASKLWEQAFVQGTPSRPTPAEVMRHFSISGGMLSTRAGWESLYIGTVTRGPDFPEALAVVADVLLNSGATDEMIERGRRLALDDVARRLNAPGRWIRDVLVQEMYGSALARRNPSGDGESLRAITPEALRRFRDDHVRGPNLIVAVVGNLEHESAVRMVGEALADVPAGDRPVRLPLPPLEPRPGWHEVKAGSQQAEVMLSVPAVGRLDPDYYPLLIVDRILGLPSGPLFVEVRDRHGLAYAVGSQINTMREVGDWSIGAGTEPQNAERLREIALDQVRAVRQNGITEQLVDEIKAYLLGSIVIGLEQYGDEAFAIAQLTLNGQTLEEHRARVREVTADDARRVAQQYLDPEKFLAVVLRP